MWNRASSHTKRKRHITASDEHDVKGNGIYQVRWLEEAAGGKIRAKLENMYDIASAVRAPGHADDITCFGGPALGMLDDDWPDRHCDHPTLASADSQAGKVNSKGAKPTAGSSAHRVGHLTFVFPLPGHFLCRDNQ